MFKLSKEKKRNGLMWRVLLTHLEVVQILEKASGSISCDIRPHKGTKEESGSISCDIRPHKAVKYTQDQIRRMEESIRVRRASEPIELVRLVNEIKEGFSREESAVKLPPPVKQKITNEILERLKGLKANANVSEQRVDTPLQQGTWVEFQQQYVATEAVEGWRNEKLEEAEQLALEKKALNSTIPATEAIYLANLFAEMLVRALNSYWSVLLEEIGLWMPAEIINNEHNDKPEGEEELDDQIIWPVPPECHAELHTDYDGVAVRWGLTHHKESAADCCQACLDQAKRAKAHEKKCNIWVYCPSETGCYSPDIYEHKRQECWLKYAEKPRLNFKNKYSEAYRNSHPSTPLIVPWISGFVIA
ncbi:hypothetical protein HHK36_030909 [Tetracentron sinense]|uniref:Apple domain-containing protein n=1 Tax=Tetracentron sinense TaxID=13715 RepID=A0A835CYR0_TETSI|nr:hypothetical protein HHK36_030909 [Tetracentron sinense]